MGQGKVGVGLGFGAWEGEKFGFVVSSLRGKSLDLSGEKFRFTVLA